MLFRSGQVLLEPVWHFEAALNSAINGEDRRFPTIKPDIERIGCQTHRTLFGFRAFAFFLDNIFQRLGRFHSGLTSKLSRQAELFAAKLVRFMVQRHRIKVLICVPNLAYIVERLRNCGKGAVKGINRKLKLDFCCSC